MATKRDREKDMDAANKAALKAEEMSRAGGVPMDGRSLTGAPESTIGMSKNDRFFSQGRAVDEQQREGYKTFGDKATAEGINKLRALQGRPAISNTPKEFTENINKSVGFGGESALLDQAGRDRALKSGIGAGLSYADADAEVQKAYDFLKKKYGDKTTPSTLDGSGNEPRVPTPSPTSSPTAPLTPTLPPVVPVEKGPIGQFFDNVLSGGSPERALVKGGSMYLGEKARLDKATKAAAEIASTATKTAGATGDAAKVVGEAGDATKAAAEIASTATKAAGATGDAAKVVGEAGDATKAAGAAGDAAKVVGKAGDVGARMRETKASSRASRETFRKVVDEKLAKVSAAARTTDRYDPDRLLAVLNADVDATPAGVDSAGRFDPVAYKKAYDVIQPYGDETMEAVTAARRAAEEASRNAVPVGGSGVGARMRQTQAARGADKAAGAADKAAEAGKALNATLDAAAIAAQETGLKAYNAALQANQSKEAALAAGNAAEDAAIKASYKEAADNVGKPFDAVDEAAGAADETTKAAGAADEAAGAADEAAGAADEAADEAAAAAGKGKGLFSKLAEGLAKSQLGRGALATGRVAGKGARLFGRVAGPALDVYDAGRFFVGGDEVKDEYEESVGTMGERLTQPKSVGEFAGAVGDVLSPVKNVLGTSRAISNLLNSQRGARESGAALKNMENIYKAMGDRRKELYPDDDFNKLTKEQQRTVKQGIRKEFIAAGAKF